MSNTNNIMENHQLRTLNLSIIQK